MFSCEAPIELTSSSLPSELISTLETEELLLPTLNNNVPSQDHVPKAHMQEQLWKSCNAY